MKTYVLRDCKISSFNLNSQIEGVFNYSLVKYLLRVSNHLPIETSKLKVPELWHFLCFGSRKWSLAAHPLFFKRSFVANGGGLASIFGAVEKRRAIKDLIVWIFMTFLYLYKFALEIIYDKIQSEVRKNWKFFKRYRFTKRDERNRFCRMKTKQDTVHRKVDWKNLAN